jgi:AAA ATPase domain
MTEQAFSVLLERDGELAAVDELIEAVPAGGQLVAIEGPPGIGKTALMIETKRLGQAAGLQVLGARGSELERSFSYGVVRQPFEPFLASVGVEECADVLSHELARDDAMIMEPGNSERPLAGPFGLRIGSADQAASAS